MPNLFFVECANILWKYARIYAYPVESARRDVEDLGALALVSVSTADLIVSALDFGVTAYDACYAALAQLLNLPLAIADAPLSRKLEGSEVKVRLLEDLFLE